tara:strand:+ start:838 stop:1287 length:450 start_codon:yes stop_codon:yes gene_type:complete
MPIKDVSRTPFINDNDDEISIGIDMPFHLGSSGWFSSTKTTIEAVKVNIKHLLKTNTGERLMQPDMGLELRNYLFNPIDVNMVVNIQNSILDTFDRWLPFVEVRDIQIIQDEALKNQFRVSIDFNIKQDPNTLESVQVDITADEEENTI